MEETKVCTNCKQEKPLKEFHVDNANRDGLRCHCKSCMTAYYQSHKEQQRRLTREWYARNREKPNKRARAHYKAHKLVRRSVARALASGEITRAESCSKCGAPHPDGHHEDYDKPLEITWLCRKCHFARHQKQINPPLGRVVVL